MKKILLAGMITMLLPIAAFAQTAATGTVTTNTTTQVATQVDPGLVPGDFFYFLDNWGESIRTFFTFDKEAKARLDLEYARERASEIKKVLSDPNRKLEDIATAKDNFRQHIADAAAIVKDEKAKGADVSKLAAELNDELDASQIEIKDTLLVHGERAGIAEAEIRAKLATLTSADPQFAGLTKALTSITKEKEDATKERNNLDSDSSDEQSVFDEAMGPEMSAQKHLEQVMRLREWMGKDGAPEGSFSTSTEQFMMQAQEAMLRGDFEAAKNMSEQAKHMFEKNKEALSGENETTSSEKTSESKVESKNDERIKLDGGVSGGFDGSRGKIEIQVKDSTDGQRESNN